MGSLTSSPPSTTTTLDTALSAATTRYHKSHPNSHATAQKASTHLPGGNTRTVLHTPPFPLAIASATAATLTTVDNHTLTDFLSEYTAGIYGHNHPTIKAAIHDAAERGWNYGAQCGLEGELASLICSRERWGAGGMEMCRFVNSGTEANVLALATAGAWVSERDRVAAEGTAATVPAKRTGVLVFSGGYHGSVISTQVKAAGATADAPGKLSLNLPYDFHVAPYNDVAAVRQVVATTIPKQSLAAILVEPMLGSGGCFPATAAFLRALRQLADETGALLIYDEVMSSRLGPHGLGYAITEGSVKPDLMTLGKYVGGGMSFGCFGGSRQIMEMYIPGSGRMEHPGTFNNNVFSMRAGVAGLNLLTREVMRGLNGRGERLKQSLEGVLQKQGFGEHVGNGSSVDDSEDAANTPPVPGRNRPFTEAELKDLPASSQPICVRGVGSLLTVHFNLKPSIKPKFQQLFWMYMVEHDFWVAARGFVALNIELTDEDCEKFVKVFESFVAEYAGLVKDAAKD